MEETIQSEQTVTQEMETAVEQIPEKKGRKYIWLICLCVVIAAAAVFLCTGKLRKYDQAETLFAQKDYDAAAQIFEELANYRDSALRTKEVRYAQARSWMAQAQYAQALEVFESLGDYKAARYQTQQCHFLLGEAAMEEGAFDTAAEHFANAQPTGEAPQRVRDAIYARGHELFLEGDTQAAQTYFDRLEGQWPENGGPHFETFDDALAYIDTLAEQLPESITLVVKDMPGTYIFQPQMLNIDIQQHMGYQFAEVDYNEKTGVLSVAPSYYPGQRLVQAWKSGDLSKLDEAELETYKKALDLVEQARAADPDPEAMELWLHDWICRNTVYDSPYMYVSPEEFIELRELTCVGVILDGVANCQGYTDAFYVLATMAGLDVCKMFGEVDGGGHCWNAVRLDGWLYLVDVTFNDTIFAEPEYWSYIWYNNVLDLDEYAVYGGTHLFYRVMSRRDLSKTYYTRIGSVYEGINYAAYGLLREYRVNGAGIYHAVIENQDYTQQEFHQALINNMTLAGVYSARYGANLYTYEGDTYICIEWF